MLHQDPRDSIIDYIPISAFNVDNISRKEGIINLTYNKMTNINWHSVREIALIAIMFLVSGLAAIHGLTSFDKVIDLITPILLLVEHALAGNSNPTVPTV